MKVDAIITWDLNKAGNEARELEEMGYAGLKSAETAHDPFCHCWQRRRLPAPSI